MPLTSFIEHEDVGIRAIAKVLLREVEEVEARRFHAREMLDLAEQRPAEKNAH